MHLFVAVDKVSLEHSDQLEGHHEADGYQVVVEDEEGEEVVEEALCCLIFSLRRKFQVPVSFPVFQLPVLNLVGPGGDERDGNQDEEKKNDLDVCHFLNSACFEWGLS